MFEQRFMMVSNQLTPLSIVLEKLIVTHLIKKFTEAFLGYQPCQVYV